MSNAKGHLLEHMIATGCRCYRDWGRLRIVKVPEPFRVVKKGLRGTAHIQFTARAEPDFIGCLRGGRAIVFEAKYTDTETMKQDALTEHQRDALTRYHELGARAGVCVGIRERVFMLPWDVFSNMKEIFGRKYVRADDIAEYEVYTQCAVFFLDYLRTGKVPFDIVGTAAERAWLEKERALIEKGKRRQLGDRYFKEQEEARQK